MFLRLCTISIATILLAGMAASADDLQVAPPPENCRVTPPPSGGQIPGEGTDPQTTQSLSGKLGPCDGVLKPPAVGDQEITQPPPDTGEMRVIQPHELPEQQSNPDGG
jgi:hypothetical protein